MKFTEATNSPMHRVPVPADSDREPETRITATTKQKRTLGLSLGATLRRLSRLRDHARAKHKQIRIATAAGHSRNGAHGEKEAAVLLLQLLSLESYRELFLHKKNLTPHSNITTSKHFPGFGSRAV